MKLLSQATFNISHSFQLTSNRQIKRCQVLELIAAYFGFKSYATLKSNDPSEQIEIATRSDEVARKNCYE
ncbi:hypothetical protein [Shewanella sp.]|uniref:hypothetical protein n=1 Tax=Shewanella sp. TaxID=50422 RepID=UPI004048A2AC